ncbi:hypothetical protein HK101_003469 [Irineochytrium annulatum]|nr:hypothetical protein HK101_003469 [Irineochytrium annulatum]
MIVGDPDDTVHNFPITTSGVKTVGPTSRAKSVLKGAQATVDLGVSRKRHARQPRTIVIAIDSTVESQEALAWALDHLVRSEDQICLSTLGFVSTTTWSDYFRMLVKGSTFGVEKAMELEQKAREVASECLQVASETIQAHSANLGEVYHIQHDILAATKGTVDPRDFIMSMCRTRSADMLVVGCRDDGSAAALETGDVGGGGGTGVTGVLGGVVGGVAGLGWPQATAGVGEYMARFAPCPVVVVRGGATKDGKGGAALDGKDGSGMFVPTLEAADELEDDEELELGVPPVIVPPPI